MDEQARALPPTPSRQASSSWRWSPFLFAAAVCAGPRLKDFLSKGAPQIDRTWQVVQVVPPTPDRSGWVGLSPPHFYLGNAIQSRVGDSPLLVGANLEMPSWKLGARSPECSEANLLLADRSCFGWDDVQTYKRLKFSSNSYVTCSLYLHFSKVGNGLRIIRLGRFHAPDNSATPTILKQRLPRSQEFWTNKKLHCRFPSSWPR